MSRIILMKILLINSPSLNTYANVKLSRGKSPNITLACLAAYVREYGYDVKIINADDGFEKLYQVARKGFDVVGISAFTSNYKECSEIIRNIKNNNPNVITIMGGVHISALPAETLAENDNLDFGVIGEGEITFKCFLDCLMLKNKDTAMFHEIDGLCFKDKNKVFVNKRRELIKNLDELPLPAYDLLDISSYELKPHQVWSYKKINLKPFMLLFTSRGCNHRCSFCSSHIIWGSRPRYKSPTKVLQEIDLLVNNFKVKALYIDDDSFVSNRENAMAILDGMIKRNYNLNFLCNARADQLDEELIIKLKKAKCHLIRIGVESCNEEILKAMKKGSSIYQVEKTFALCRKIGIAASASLIIGHPPENWKTFRETIFKIKKINPLACEFFIAVPDLGTDLYKLAMKNSYILARPWEEWKHLPVNPVLSTPDLKPEELIAMQKIAFKEFYFRPTKIVEILKQINSLEKLSYCIKGLLSFASVIK